MRKEVDRNNIRKYKDKAFYAGEYVAYYQPKYNLSTGVLVGAEALVRWNSKEMGFVMPSDFIPVFEEDDTITKLDLYVFEQVCQLLNESKENNYYMVPISINITRYDIYSDGFIDKIDEISSRYGIDSSYIIFEITESSAIGSTDSINARIKQLHERGYHVAMDDFGKGYSSLNVLRNLDIDEIKVDIDFIKGNIGDKGGIILGSIVNMAKWLQLPVIVEGVETIDQSEFLKSIGCKYIQGNYFSTPVAKEDYVRIVASSTIGVISRPLNLAEHFNSYDFWNPRSLDTLIFSNLVGGASVFMYDRLTEQLEILRVNEKYVKEMGMNNSQVDIILSDPWAVFDEENRKIYENTLNEAIDANDEVSCETWRTVTSACCGTERLCIRSDIRAIGQSDSKYLFYTMIRNITAEKEKHEELLRSDTIMRNTFDQINIYYWEYNLLNKEMRPCFRCMRDLNLPPIIKNYPDSALELGIITEEYMNMYKDFVNQLYTGVNKIEAVVPLTANKIPFKIRYTTEFDELGNPIKAFASATYIEA